MNKVHEKQLLLGQIILKRKVMYHRAKHLGINHYSVIRCSQELDVLLNQYQEISELIDLETYFSLYMDRV